MMSIANTQFILSALVLTTMFVSPSLRVRQGAAAINNRNPDKLSKSRKDDSGFYTFRPDLRKCASPLCGGYFVKLVNQPLTRCANGRAMNECYVVNIDWGSVPEVDAKHALLQGSILTRGDRHGKYGVLKVSEVWKSMTTNKIEGDYFLVRDLGIRCIAAPCNTHQETKLNSALERKIAGVSLKDSESSEVWTQALTAMTKDSGVIVVGTHEEVTGPAGRGQTLRVTRFYLPVNPQ